MTEHWPSVVSAVFVIAIGIIIKYNFVTKNEWEKRCEDMRVQCQNAMCREINNVAEAGILKTGDLTQIGRDTTIILDAIREDISDIKAELTGQARAFKQYLDDQ
jgi:hypothetical protein